jgi:hypothetical protein
LLKGGFNMRFIKSMAVVATVLALAAILAAGANPAAGNTTSVTATASGTGSFVVIAIYTNSPAGTPATLTANGTGVFSSASASGATGVTVSGFTAGAKTVTTTADTSGVTTDTISVQAVFTCQAAGQVTFVLTQAGGAPASSSSTPVTCTAGTGTTTGALTVSPAAAQIGQQVSISGACQAGATLTATPPAGSFTTAVVNGAPAVASGAGIACSAAGTLSATFVCSQQATVTFNLAGATGTLSCGTAQTYATAGQYSGQPYNGMPYNGMPYAGQPSGNTGLNQVPNLANAANSSGGSSLVSIQVSPSSLSCGTPGTVTVSARGPDGQALQQGTVNLYTTTGAVEPKNGTISNGVFTTRLTPPNLSGTVTLSATVNGVTNSTDVKVDCAGGTPQAAAASTSSSPTTGTSPLPAPLSAPNLGGVAISPPSTGDAGLARVTSGD